MVELEHVSFAQALRAFVLVVIVMAVVFVLRFVVPGCSDGGSGRPATI